MPYKSKAMMRKFFAMEADGELPEGTAREWAHHTPNIKDLPDRVGDGKTKEGNAVSTVAALARKAAADARVEKLAADTQVSPDLVRELARRCNLSPEKFTKLAYDDPAGYVIFLKLASGGISPQALTKGAMAASPLVTKLLQYLKTGGGAVRGAAQAARGKPGAPQGGFFGASAPSQAPGAAGKIDRMLGKSPIGGSQAGRAATGVAGAGAVGGGAAAGVNSAMPAKPAANAPEQAGQHEQTVNAQIGGSTGPIAQPQAPAPQPGANPAAAGGAPQPQKPGMSPAGKALVAAGGVGLGALGAGAMLRRRKQNKQVTAHDVAAEVLRRVVVKTAAARFRKEAADKLVAFLDAVAAKLPLEKAAAVRAVQGAVSAGKPLAHAIKLAYPTLSGEQRGILATRFVSGAVKHAAFKGKTVGRTEATVKMKDGAVGKMKSMSC